MSLITWTRTGGTITSRRGDGTGREGSPRDRRRGRDRLGVRARLRRRGRAGGDPLPHEPRPGRGARPRDGRRRAPGRPDRGGRGRGAVRGGGAGARRRRGLRGGGRLLAARGRACLAPAARAVGGDATHEPHGDLPHRARVPPARRAQRARQPRPRRVDRGTLRRGRTRRLCRGQGRDPGRAAPEPQERDRPDRAARPGQRRRAGLDLLPDDPRRARREARGPDQPDDGVAEGRAGGGRGARRRRPRLRRALRSRHGRARDGRGRDGRPHAPRGVSRFLERLATETPIVADGGMGAVLSSAVPGLRCPEEANLRAPESVLEVHLGYINAGAELIETNSFGANRAKLARQFLGEELEQINAAAVRIAREAREVAGRDVFNAGSVGPLGDVEASGLDPSELFAEQARLLEGRGVDLFMVETFYDLEELETAIAAVRSVSALPLVALMTFDAQGETLAGVKAEDAAARLRPLGLAAFGANHGAGPAAALAALARMGDDGAVLAALPNVGLASMTGQRIVFPHATPAYFSDFAAQARALGARLIGGCCGTTPSQVAAIREAVDADRRPAGSLLVHERKQAAPFEPASGETQLARMLR